MFTYQEKVDEFLAQKHIAVVGLSGKEKNAGNFIFEKLRANGYTVYPVNPNATAINGEPSYSSVRALPCKPDGVVIITRPDVTRQVVEDCAAAGVKRVWLHSSIVHGGTSFSQDAVDYCNDHHIEVIEGGCPMMFAGPVDIAHKCIKWMMKVTGDLPK